LLKKLEHGPTLTVWKLDRLRRSLRDLITMLDDLKQRGVKFRSITEAIDTHTPTRRARSTTPGIGSTPKSAARTWPLLRVNRTTLYKALAD